MVESNVQIAVGKIRWQDIQMLIICPANASLQTVTTLKEMIRRKLFFLLHPEIIAV
jgi:hypothetical protein